MRTALLSTLLFLTSIAFGQKEGAIQGTVIDVNTEEPLAFAKVFVEGTEFGAVTDIDGNFRIELPVGTYTLRVTFVGYEPLKKFNVPVSSGNVETVNFTLNEASSKLDEVQVVYKRTSSHAR